MKIAIPAFNGIAPKYNARYLPDGGAQIALNVEAFGQSLKPMKGLGSSVLALGASGVQSLYKAGQDYPADNVYWVRWTVPVQVCKSQIAGDDTSEWTFWSGQTYPRMATLAQFQADLTGNTSYRLGLPAPETALTLGTVTVPDPDQTAAVATMSASSVAAVTVEYGLKISVDAGVTNSPVAILSAPATAADLVTAINGAASSIVTAEVDSGAVKVTSVGVGKDVKLVVRWGDGASQYVSSSGTTADLGTKETRVYVFTWISNLNDLIIESAPSLPLEGVEVYPGGEVSLSRSEAAPRSGGYLVTGWRVYRATAGVYLLVNQTDIAHNVTTFTDDVAADALGEACPSITWTPPPTRGSGAEETFLQGLINLPNGMMAGFMGRELHFCEPYRPYAWPESYQQVVDYPIVGLGRTDTTLVVLTVGAPYFAQGSSPAYLTLVKSDLEQACVSARSIVSMGGSVFYAAPDGLMMLSSSGSRILTQELFSRDDWQAMSPNTIMAVGHDNKYLAFHDPVTIGGVVYNGFVVDLTTKQFIRHNISGVTAAYADTRNDKLFVAASDNALHVWGAGSSLLGKWRSKKFSLPQITGFSCAQVEAEAYDASLKCRVYATDPSATTAITTSLTGEVLTSRAPFRLQAVQARDWEIELEVSQEIFNVCLAQAAAELATG